MASNTAIIYGGDAMLKVISDSGSVRLKVCPEVAADENGVVYDEVDRAVSVDLNQVQLNRLIADLKTMGRRVFGKNEW